jgi:hypothetical protein
MPLFSGKRQEHDVVVYRYGDASDASFIASCSCSQIASYATSDEAFAYAHGHAHAHHAHGENSTVSEEIQFMERGGGWLCLFCGDVADEAFLRLSVSWTDDGEEAEHWYAAHRACLAQRMSNNEEFQPPPFAAN